MGEAAGCGSGAVPERSAGAGEILRRYAMSGVSALKNLSEQDRARMQHEHQATMTVAGPEGDKPRTILD